MMNKGKLLALVMALVLMLAVAATAGAVVSYDYRLPDGYDASKDINYPVVYILPQDGYAKDTSAIYEKFKNAMADGTGMNMILVKPQFEKGMDLNAELDALVATIDSKYNTIADPAYRTLIGTGTGGYLAYALGMKSETFGNLASINGNFVDNPWYATYGDVLKMIEKAGKNGISKYYTYMDAPVDGTWTNMENSSNDIGQVLIEYGLLPNQCEYTVRPGIYDDAFVTESVNRVADRLTNNMFGSIISGSITLDKSVLTSDDKNVDANYSVSIADTLSTFVGGETKANVTVSVVDANGNVLSSKTDSGKTVSAGSTISNDNMQMANKATETCAVNVTVEIMGAKFDVATVNLIISQDPTADSIDLMGDWYFHFAGSKYEDMAALSSTDKSYLNWATGQPGLTSWTYGFGDINEITAPPMWGMAYFDYTIVGSGYYVKDFYVPANFNIDGAVLSLGYLDDYDEVFINGVRIGGTGIEADGNFSGDSGTWAVYSVYELGENESVIKLGATNTIVVRCHNSGIGGGGWYGGPIGLYSAEGFAEINPDAIDPYFYEETFVSKYAASALGQSGTIDNEYLIYLPKDYYETDRFYPTLYLMHQYNSDHTSYKTDKINELMDEGIAEGMFDEMIVVIPNSDGNSWWRGDWLKMISEELVPHIDANYRTIPDARYRFTAGCSMGGQGAFGVALQNPDLFSGAISFFGAFSMGGTASPNTIAKNESAEYMDNFAMYFICGNQDIYQFGIPAIELNQQLEAMGVDHAFLIDNGEHNSVFYVPHFKEAIQYVRNNMYKNTSGSAAYLVNVDYSATAESLTATVRADDSIKKYFNVIPASSYTKNTNPGITLPIVATIKYQVKPSALAFLYSSAVADTEEVQVKFNVTFDDNTFVVTETIDLTDVLPQNAVIEEVEFHTQLLGRDYIKNDDQKTEELKVVGVNLPQTGDNSNIALFASLLLISVAGMVVVSRKKAAC